MRLIALGLVVVIGFGSCSNDPIKSDNDVDTIRFLTIGDFGETGSVERGVADLMEELASTKRVDFVLALGDNFYPSGVTSVDDPQWKTTYENVFNGEALKQIPWYVALGNHDYVQNPVAEIEYTDISSRWNMPDYFYTKTFPLGNESVRIVVMDTNPFEKSYYAAPDDYSAKFLRDSTSEKIWLDSVFALKDASWTIVTGHHPFYTGGKRINQANSVRASLLPLFAKHDLPVYFSGHEHDLQHLKLDGMSLNQFVCGVGAKTTPAGSMEYTKFSAAENGVMAVEVTKDVLSVYVINSDLDTLYQTRIERKL